jgi:hypothetical protein
MPADAFIQCRVTAEMKTVVRALAEREQITESALVKELLQVVLRTTALQGFAKLDELDRRNRDARLSVRLEHEDRQLLAGRATQRGMPSATYVSLLVRAHLRGVAPLPKEEFLALRHSIAELKAVGRNLNQMAKALNQDPRSIVPGRNEVNAMLKVAEGLRDHFKALLKHMDSPCVARASVAFGFRIGLRQIYPASDAPVGAGPDDIRSQEPRKSIGVGSTAFSIRLFPASV